MSLTRDQRDILIVAGNHRSQLTAHQRKTVDTVNARLSRINDNGRGGWLSKVESQSLGRIAKKLAHELSALQEKRKQENPTRKMCAQIRQLHGL